jgi:excisionase family DNA binding protein
MPHPKQKSIVASVVIIPRVLTISDAARYLSATLWFTEQLLRDGQVRSFIQGKSRVVDRLELDKYVDRRNAEKSQRLIERLENLKAA